MMAAYWKSPYKESSYFGNRGSTSSSTGRFEQSLSLSRAKSSVLPGGQDLLGWHLPSPRRPGSSQQYNKSTNGSLKGILKTPRAKLSPRVRVRAADDGRQDESGSDQKSTTIQRSSKRVSFGPNEEAVDEDSEYSLPNTRGGSRDHYVTLQRINHSRQVEETAMQRLNKLISGVHVKNPHQPALGVGGSKSSYSKISPLPVVDGKGLLTPRSAGPTYYMPVSRCKHGTDVKCLECANKDVETGEVLEDKPTPVKQQQQLQQQQQHQQQDGVCNDSVPIFGTGPDTDSGNEHTMRKGDDETSSMTVKVPLPLTLFDDASQQVQEKTTLKQRRTTQRKPKSVVFQNKKLQSKLLPGRYPFTVGAIHVRNVGLKKSNADKPQTDIVDTTSSSTNPISGQTGTEQDRVTGSLQPDPSKPNQQLESSESTRTQSTVISEGNEVFEQVPVVKARGDIKDRRLTDKTSQILTWLKDVRQKQNFKPRTTRFLVIESQPTP